MGANLNRLMSSYGVSTPTISRYSGTAPTAVAADATPEQQGVYQGALAKYNAEKEAHSKYAADYKNRVMSTDLYSSPAMNILPQAQQKAQWSSNLTTPDYSKVQVPKTDVGQPGAAPDYASMVNSAYAGLGRKGIGTEVSNIDQAGYDYWTGKLKSGEIAPANFHETFMGGAKDYMGANTNNNVTNYVQGYLNKTSQPDNYANLINTAYAGVGRSGIGTGLSNIDQTGYDYWMNKLNSGAIAPDSFNAAFAQGAKSYMGQNPTTDYTKFVQGYLGMKPPAATTDPISSIDNTPMAPPTVLPDTSSTGVVPAGPDQWAYAHGGPVRHFAVGGSNRVDGGINDLADKYAMDNPAELPEIYAAADTGTMTDASAPKRTDRVAAPSVPVSDSRLQDMQNRAVRVGEPPMQRGPVPEGEAAPQMTTPMPVATAAAAPAGQTPLDVLHQKYLNAGKQAKSGEMTAAEQKYASKNDALINLLKEQANKTDENAPSKAEMYFRLAAALASPTKTGGVMENVALAAKELADFQKSTTDAKKAAAAAKLQLLLKTGEIDAQQAKEELANLKEGEKEARGVAQTFALEEYKVEAKKGEPQSEFGKILKESGIQPGTQAYKDAMAERGRLETETKGAALRAARSTEDQKNKLTPKEGEKVITLDTTIRTQESALAALKKARVLSDEAYLPTLWDTAEKAVQSQIDENDPKVKATETLNRILNGQALQAASKMKGSLSDKDLSFLREISGQSFKNRGSRNETIDDAIKTLEDEIADSKRYMQDVKSRKYLDILEGSK
jgi:hypothetical protein